MQVLEVPLPGDSREGETEGWRANQYLLAEERTLAATPSLFRKRSKNAGPLGEGNVTSDHVSTAEVIKHGMRQDDRIEDVTHFNILLKQ